MKLSANFERTPCHFNFIIIGLLFPLLINGCQSDRPNFTQDIAPVIFKNCTQCHRDNEIGPFPFTNYPEVAEFAEMIGEVTQSGYMPPWKADTSYSHFQGERSLTRQEMDLIRKWVNNGYPEGPLDSLPPLPDFKADFARYPSVLSLKMKKPYQISNDGNDQFKYFILPKLDRDYWVKAIEFKPGNQRLVHHGWYYEDTTGFFAHLDSMLPGYAWDFMRNGEFFPLPDTLLDLDPEIMAKKNAFVTRMIDGGAGYSPGYRVMPFPTGAARKFRRNTSILLQIHYSGTSKRGQLDSTSLNLYFTNEPVQNEIKFDLIEEKHIQNPPFIIPANEIRRYHAEFKVDKPIALINIMPHMHLRGSHFKSYVMSPAGDTTRLIRINEWDFNWQGIFYFREPILIPEGYKIISEGEFDNRATNPRNPISPPVNVGWGWKSSEEMFGTFFEYYELPEN